MATFPATMDAPRSLPATMDAPQALSVPRFEVSTLAVRVWWAAYLLLTPFYVFTSGIPQPADLFFVGTFPFVFLIWINRIPNYTSLWLGAACFSIYITLVNIYWFLVFYSGIFLMHALYYSFNMLIVMIVLTIFNCNAAAFARTTRGVFFVLLIVEAFWVAAFGNNIWGRAIGTFNDPNQMGYWTLLTTVCIFVLRPDRMLRPLDVASLALAFYIILMSVSRSSMLAFACLLLIVLAFSKVRFRMILGILSVLFIGALIIHNFGGIDNYYESAIQFFEKRAVSTTNRYDSLGSRSLDRVWQFPQYLLLGSGEGEYLLRFGIKNEAHSSLVAILFCYGIVGFSFFWYLIYVFLHQASWFRIMLFVPPMVYGIANQGVRFSLFWIFLSFVLAMSQQTETFTNGRSRASTES